MGNKNRKSLLIIALTGLILSNSIPLTYDGNFIKANADEPYIPISDYHFNNGNPGLDSKQHYSLASQGNPIGTGSNTTYGTVTFNGKDDLLTTNGVSTSNTNNLFYDYASSNLTIAFDFTIKSFSSDWMFPMTFFNGGDIWNFEKGHVGFVIDPDNYKLRYADTAGTTGLTDWWYPEICQLEIDTTITIIVTINKSGNTCIYLDGSPTPIYNKASYADYNVSGTDWSGFSLGAFAWRNGSFAMKSGGHGFTNCTFKNLKIYDFVFSTSQVSSWAVDKDIYKTSYSISYETNGGTINSGKIDSYVGGVQYYLPTDVTKPGYVFCGWYDNELFNGNPVTFISKTDEGNKNYYAKWTVAEIGDGELIPDYYYLFNDASDPGKESNLKASLKTKGSVSISNGSALFNGNSALYATGESGYLNYSNSLSSFTMGLDLTLTSTSENWQFPLSFGFNDSKWLNLQIAPNSRHLMFSCSGAKQGDQTNAYWGHTVIDNLNLNQTYRITLSFAPGKTAKVYLNGSLALSTSVDSGFDISGNNFNFSIGADYNSSNNSLQNGFIGQIANFDVYSFASNDKESIQDGVFKKIYYDNYSITLNTNGGTYISEYKAPTSYKTREGIDLPKSSQIIKNGYTFKGWFSNPSFTGNPITSISKNDSGNKTYYAKWIDSSLSTEPIAYYTFENPLNPGEDSAGSYNMEAINASINSGELSVTGSGAIYAYGNGSNFMNDYQDFTLSFDANFHNLGSSEWKIPFSFGNNGTQAGCFNLNPDDPHNLRFKLRDGNTLVAGDGNDMLWGSKLTYLPEWTWINFTIAVTAATATTKGSIAIYVDGILVLSKALPIGFQLPVDYLSFGGYYNGSSVSNGVDASFRNIRAYNFAATENQVNYYINNAYDLPGDKTLEIHYNVGEHGYIIAPRIALKNEVINVQTVPSEDYITDQVVVNGEAVTPTSNNVYKIQISDVTTIDVSFVKNVYTMTSSIFGSGTVKFESGGDEVNKVSKGQPVKITLIPQEGYQVGSIRVNGITQTLVNGVYEIESVNEDINVIASFEEIKPEHVVTFIKNGGEWTNGSLNDEITFTESIGCSLPGGIDINRFGYDFAGWWLDEECEVNHIASIDETIKTDLTLYAKWEPVDYSISYLNLDGAVILDNDYPTGYKYGDFVTLPSNVNKKGYNFLGWYDNPNYDGDPITSISSSEYGDKLFYAKLEKATYTISLYTNGGDYESGYVLPVLYRYGEEVILPNENNIHKNGYKFLGWYDNPQFSGEIVLSIDSQEYGDKNYYARWDNEQYEINYNLNGGNFIEEPNDHYTYGTEYILPTTQNIHKTGYTFVGWYLDPYFESDEVTNIEIGTTGTQNYYAKYEANKYSVTYLESNGNSFEGEHADTYVKTYQYDQNSFLDNPIRDGYEFGGYYLDPSCTQESLVTTLYKETYTTDIVLYVHWNLVGENNIYYYLNGGEWIKNTYPTSYNAGVDITLPSESYLNRNGYLFLGWYDNNGNKVEIIPSTESGAKTYFAKWEKIIYTITYCDGNEIAHVEDQYSIGSFVELPRIEKDGYLFVSWCTDPTLSNEIKFINADDYGNKTLYAKWEEIKNVYTIIFDSNNGSGESNNVVVMRDVDIDLNNYIFELNNYYQIGWIDSSNNQYSLTAYQNLANKNDTLILYAVYSPDTYDINFITNGGYINSGEISQYSYGEEIELPTDVVRDGFIFAGWYLDETFEGGKVSIIPKGSNSNFVLYAKWSENVNKKTYSISLNLNGGKILGDNVYYYEEGLPATLPTNVYLKGYTFKGWYLDNDYSGSPIEIIEADSTGDKTYYAKWEADTYKVTVAENKEGTISVSNSEAKYNSQITIDYIVNYGYELTSIAVNGVELEPDSNNNYSFLLTSDSYVEAVFSKISFVVNFEETKNGLVESEYDSVDFGDIIDFVFTPRKGYCVKSVYINGQDVTHLVINNVLHYRADLISEEDLGSDRKQLTIKATFKKENSNNGCQGDISSNIYIIIPITVVLAGLIIFRNKEYYKKPSRRDD